MTDAHKETIHKAIENGRSNGYDIAAERYFFVEQFYDTNFRKTTPRAPMGTRIFDLTQVLETEKIPDAEMLAKQLAEKTWE